MTDHHHVVVDTDTGIDDALALLYLAGRPDASLSAVTAVYGNAPLDEVVPNIGHVLELAGLPDTPVAVGAAGPIDGEPRIADHVHGKDGLGDVITDRREPRNLVDASAAQYLVDLSRERPGHHDLLVLGPTTNIGLAIEIDPDVLTRYRSVVFMGGSGPFPQLGVSQMVDANIHNDPVAAGRMIAAPRARMVSVGVNATAPTIVDEAAVERLHASGTAWGEFVATILESYMDFYQHAWGRRVSPAHDGLAAGVLLRPELATDVRRGPMNITSDGFFVRAHLMETFEGEPVPWETVATPETEVVMDVDRQAFLDDFLGVLAAGVTR